MAKVWLITGASSGFGEALVKSVLASGDKVAATFRKPEQAHNFTEQNHKLGLGIVMDLTDQKQIDEAVKQAVTEFGAIDVLVNNAGYGTIGAIEEFSMQQIRQQMESNFFGAIAITKAVLPLMREKKRGHIIQISSQAGFRATAGFGLYNASKFALEGFSEALAQEVSSFNIKVVIVEPGPFRTKFAGSSIVRAEKKIEEYQQTPVAQMYQYIATIDGKQEGDPVKGAKAILDYVNNNRKPLRLPLGKMAVQGIKAKLNAVQMDIEENEAIALSVVY